MIKTTDLFKNGVYFGYPTSNWNPKTSEFILDKQNGIYIINLFKTINALNSAYGFVKKIVMGGGKILFVGTKKQASDSIERYATECNMPYISVSWPGGTLTNFRTIIKRVNRMIELENMDLDADNDENDSDVNDEKEIAEVGFAYTTKQKLTKKEKLLLKKELLKLQKTMNGIRDIKKLPDALFIVDTIKEQIALTEAKKLNIPVVATIDTNGDPDLIDQPIPGNDNSRSSIDILTSVICQAVKDGQKEILQLQKKKKSDLKIKEKRSLKKVIDKTIKQTNTEKVKKEK